MLRIGLLNKRRIIWLSVSLEFETLSSLAERYTSDIKACSCFRLSPDLVRKKHALAAATSSLLSSDWCSKLLKGKEFEVLEPFDDL
jgi:hypothetical protein